MAMTLKIVQVGDPVLRQTARALAEDEIRSPEIQRLIDLMRETMRDTPGVGLAAPQVGVALRIFVVDVSVGRDPNGLIVMINPEFVERDGVQLEEEGCLSVPGFNATVMRPSRAVVKGRDRNWEERTHQGSGLLARAFQPVSYTHLTLPTICSV